MSGWKWVVHKIVRGILTGPDRKEDQQILSDPKEKEQIRRDQEDLLSRIRFVEMKQDNIERR